MSEQTLEKKPLHVVALQVTNVMGVKSVSIVPGDDNVIVLGGDNGAGKTSTIDSIWKAIGGKPKETMPIRRGEETAEIFLDLGDIKVTRRFRKTASGEIATDIKVANGEGAEYRGPQTLLDGLVSKFAFDPFEFTRMKPKEQVEKLKTILKVDVCEIQDERKAAYDERTFVGRTLSDLEAKNRNIVVPDDTPDEEVVFEDITEELNKAQAHNNKIEENRIQAKAGQDRIDACQNLIASQRAKIEEIQEQIDALARQMEALATKKTEAQSVLDNYETKLPPIVTQYNQVYELVARAKPVDLAPIQERLRSAEEINRNVRLKKSKADAKAEWMEAESKRIALNATIEDCDARMVKMTEDAVQNAKLAVPGFTFTDDGLFVNGIPFDQCNTAEKIKISVALAVHENPRLRVFRIADGEKLTPANLDVLRKIAEENDAQIWVEFACTAEDIAMGYRDVSFLIEDGEVADMPARAVAS